MTDKSIGAYVTGNAPADDLELTKCPRCGYTARHFDLLAIQPHFMARDKLRPVYKCPECKHLFALAADSEVP